MARMPARNTEVVVLHLSHATDFLSGPVGKTLAWVAESIARFKHCEFGGVYDRDAHGMRTYFVPDETLLCEQAEALGIRSEHDLFGGVVPYAFVKTKIISHTLVDRRAERPDGWSDAFIDHI